MLDFFLELFIPPVAAVAAVVALPLVILAATFARGRMIFALIRAYHSPGESVADAAAETEERDHLLFLPDTAIATLALWALFSAFMIEIGETENSSWWPLNDWVLAVQHREDGYLPTAIGLSLAAVAYTAVLAGITWLYSDSELTPFIDRVFPLAGGVLVSCAVYLYPAASGALPVLLICPGLVLMRTWAHYIARRSLSRAQVRDEELAARLRPDPRSHMDDALRQAGFNWIADKGLLARIFHGAAELGEDRVRSVV